MMTTGEQIFHAVVFQFMISGGISTYKVWEGGSVLLQCGADSSGESFKEWCKMEENLDCKLVLRRERQTTYVFHPWTSADVQLVDGSSLRLTSVSYPRDNGIFRCFSGEADKSVELFILAGAKNLTLSGPAIPMPENTEVTFTCEAEGWNPAPIITWEIGKTSILPKATVSDVSSQISLTLTRDMDNQELICRAQRQFTGATRLGVKYKPTAKIQITPAEYHHGDQVSLWCLVDGNPDPDITWIFDDKLITDVPPPRNTLHIGALKQSHTGIYTCLAVNSEGNGTAKLTLATKKRKKLLPQLGLVLWTSLGVALGSLIIGLIVRLCYLRVRKTTNQAMNSGEGESIDLQTMPENVTPENDMSGNAMPDNARLEKVVVENATPEIDVTRNPFQAHHTTENVVEHLASENVIAENDLDEDPSAESPSNGMASAAEEEHVYEDISEDLLPAGMSWDDHGNGKLNPVKIKPKIRKSGLFMAEKHMSGMTKAGIIKHGKAMPGITKHGKTIPGITKHGKPMPEKPTSEDIIDELPGATIKERDLRSGEGSTDVVQGDVMIEKTTPKVLPRITVPPKGLPVNVSAEKAMPENLPYENVTSAMTGARPKEYAYHEPSDIPDESPTLPCKKKLHGKVLPHPPHKKRQKPKKVCFTSPSPSLVFEQDTYALMALAAPRPQVLTCPPAAEGIHTCPSAAEVAVEVLKLLNVRTQPSASGQTRGHEAEPYSHPDN